MDIVLSFVGGVVVASLLWWRAVTDAEQFRIESVGRWKALYHEMTDYMVEQAKTRDNAQHSVAEYWRNRCLAVERGSTPADDEVAWKCDELQKKMASWEGEL